MVTPHPQARRSKKSAVDEGNRVCEMVENKKAESPKPARTSPVAEARVLSGKDCCLTSRSVTDERDGEDRGDDRTYLSSRVESTAQTSRAAAARQERKKAKKPETRRSCVRNLAEVEGSDAGVAYKEEHCAREEVGSRTSLIDHQTPNRSRDVDAHCGGKSNLKVKIVSSLEKKFQKGPTVARDANEVDRGRAQTELCLDLRRPGRERVVRSRDQGRRDAKKECDESAEEKRI